ncbi:hypothetical protein RHDE110596_23790 [Prescottella defluvii]|uniref:DUF7691 family protein n=1 Tax=Prescottella defluvii TaxID=1323361 RepID=UPI0004F3388F|nr:hypothetical protein [Prescottella defluvii]
MGSFISFALADIAKIEAACGSRDAELFARLVEENREDLEADLEEREPDEISQLEALRRLIFGEDTGSDWNDTFNEAYATLASEFECRWLADIRPGWTEWMDAELNALNVDAARLEWFREFSPWTNEDCRRVWEQWQAVMSEQHASLSPRAAEQIGEWMGWVEEAASTTNLGILGVSFE